MSYSPSPLPCPVCQRTGRLLDDFDSAGRQWSVCTGPHDADTDMISPDGGVKSVAIPDMLIFTHDIRDLLQSNGRLKSHRIDEREWLIRIVVDGTVLTLQSHPNLNLLS